MMENHAPQQRNDMRKKSEERRQSILDVAAELFNEIGFDRTSMAEISARLGGSKATLYNYFSSKEDIFLEVMRKQAGMQFESLFASLVVDKQAEHIDSRIMLTQFAIDYLTLVLTPEILSIRRMLVYNAERSKLGCLYYDNGPKRGVQAIANFIEEAMTHGQLRRDDPWLSAVQFRVLIEAEWMEVCMLGVITTVSPGNLKESVDRALDAFYRIYGC